jgi:hypothetical protein
VGIDGPVIIIAGRGSGRKVGHYGFGGIETPFLEKGLGFWFLTHYDDKRIDIGG